MNADPRRAEVAAQLWQVAEHNIIAEWICCDPVDPKHQLCMQGDATLRMTKALLVDDPDAWKPAPLLDEVMRLLLAAGGVVSAAPDQADVERIAEALWPLTDWDGDRLNAERAAAAVLAVLPPPADRAAVLREAADILWNHPRATAIDSDFRSASDVLRRVAAEAPQPECSPACSEQHTYKPGCALAVGAQQQTQPDDPPVQCWHTESGSPCDWNVCRQPERLAAGDRGTDPAAGPRAADDKQDGA